MNFSCFVSLEAKHIMEIIDHTSTEIELLKIEILNSGYHGSLCLQNLVWTLLVSTYFIVQ